MLKYFMNMRNVKILSQMIYASMYQVWIVMYQIENLTSTLQQTLSILVLVAAKCKCCDQLGNKVPTHQI